METGSVPQAYLSSYAPRLRAYNNSLLNPVISTLTGPQARTTKRGTTLINYAEDGYDYEDDDDDDRRRPTGLRSLRREDSNTAGTAAAKVGKDARAPVEVQGIWRDWMLKGKQRSDLNNQAQAQMPVTLIPIRIDVDIPAFMPAAPFPLPRGSHQITPQMDGSLYRMGELTVPYKLRDIFLWNLHETVITTDQFAMTLVQDLDLPNQGAIANEISKQIRTQLEEYAGVALHPLFHSEETKNAPSNNIVAAASTALQTPAHDSSAAATTPRPAPATNVGPSTPVASGTETPSKAPASQVPGVTATATPISADDTDEFSPDDTYRCLVTLNMNLGSNLYTDKFEWSLLHSPGTAEAFAKVTCTDLGLSGEWVPALTHAIYEAVLRLKKEACEAGGLVTGWGATGSEFPNDAAHGAEAGWRYDPEHLADEWEPKIEILSKDEMEKREGDRERQIRRLRRETARFSSVAGMIGGTPIGNNFGVPEEEERMGRGERSKKKRRFRSLSPLARSGTPGGWGTPDVGYGGGGAGSLADQERLNWRCTHCRIWGTSVWAVRDGPYGPRVSINNTFNSPLPTSSANLPQSLCANCGFLYEKNKKLPRWTQNLHYMDHRPF
jgi:chromatin structure-remodeling complex subunit SFH1